MSCSKNVTVWCDWQDCHRFWKAGSQRSVRDARAEATWAGWAYTGGRDLCPEHAREHAQR